MGLPLETEIVEMEFIESEMKGPEVELVCGLL